jgi:hypothetical protein
MLMSCGVDKGEEGVTVIYTEELSCISLLRTVENNCGSY